MLLGKFWDIGLYLSVTYGPLVRVEVVGQAAHVGGGRGAQTLRVEEWRQWRPATTLEHYYHYYYCQPVSGRRCYLLSLHLQTRFDLLETQFEFEVDAGDYSK